jgi:hypothetical protein
MTDRKETQPWWEATFLTLCDILIYGGGAFGIAVILYCIVAALGIITGCWDV